MHCSLNINTETGRLSARRPNLQNQPALEKDRYKVSGGCACVCVVVVVVVVEEGGGPGGGAGGGASRLCSWTHLNCPWK